VTSSVAHRLIFPVTLFRKAKNIPASHTETNLGAVTLHETKLLGEFQCEVLLHLLQLFAIDIHHLSIQVPKWSRFIRERSR